MNTPMDIVLEIEKLSPVERVRLVDLVMRDAITPNSAIEKAWAEEAAKRWTAYKNGAIQPISYEDAMSKYGKP